MDSITSALRNLESRLSMALDNAQQAETDLNRVRLQCGLSPIQYFHLSAAIPVEVRARPKTGGVSLTPEMMVDAGRVRRGEVVSMAEAARLRVEEDKRR
jgi:hypothetical protein